MFKIGNKEISCTYKYNGRYTFDWLDENEVEDWVDENEDKYEDIEIVRVKVTQLLFVKKT